VTPELRRARLLAAMDIDEWAPRALAVAAVEPPAISVAALVESQVLPVSAPAALTIDAPVALAEAPADAPSSPMADRRKSIAAMDWSALEADASGCRACTLCASRKNVVFGVGPRTARLLVIGEAPGVDEDARGEPFVGQAGKLLDSMLAAIGLNRREHVYIANVLKCHPPANRDPLPDEIHACSMYLARQAELLAPDLVLLVGRFAAQAMLGSDVPIGRLRGRVHEFDLGGRRVPAVVSYHPAYLLRSPSEKAKTWADLCLAMDALQAASAQAVGAD